MTSNYIGVSLNRKSGKWTAYIKIKGKSIHLGTHETPEDAVDARNFYIVERGLDYRLQNIRKEGEG